MKTILITIGATALVTTLILAGSTYLWLESLPKVYSCTKI
jgi:hypothetical protein